MKQSDALTILAMLERSGNEPLVVVPVSQAASELSLSDRIGWESLSQYARFCASGCEGLATPMHVFEACKELMATT